jgi:hypothetical protein
MLCKWCKAVVMRMFIKSMPFMRDMDSQPVDVVGDETI